MKRFNLIDFAIGTLIVVAISTLGLGTCGCNATGVNKESAQDNAKKFAKELDLDVKKISCNNSDSDGDGYVSCTFAMKSGAIEQFECASWGLNSGCRRPKMSINPINQQTSME